MTEPQVVDEARAAPDRRLRRGRSGAEPASTSPSSKMPDIIPPAEQARLRAAGQGGDRTARSRRPTGNSSSTSTTSICRTAARSIAAQALPNGKAYYAFQVRQYTTTDLTPAQIHAMGLRKVAEIHAQMEQVFRQVGFKGSYQDFVHYLRTNPRFYYKDPKQLLEAYRAAAKRVDPLLVTEFPVWILPRVPTASGPFPPRSRPTPIPPTRCRRPATAAWRATWPSISTSRRAGRSTRSRCSPVTRAAPATSCRSRSQMELKNLPDFRRFDYYSSFGEGWALYTETLCDEMGLYDDSLLAVRLSRLPDVAGGAAGRGHGHPLRGLDARAGRALLRGQQRPQPSRTSTPRSTATSPGPARRCPT